MTRRDRSLMNVPLSSGLISCSSRKTATLIAMMDLQTGETPLNQPDPPVSPR